MKSLDEIWEEAAEKTKNEKPDEVWELIRSPRQGDIIVPESCYELINQLIDNHKLTNG